MIYFQVPIQVFCCEFGNFFQKSFCAEHIWENIDDIIFSFDDIIGTIVMLCAIWYHLYNLEKAKSTHGGVLLLVKLQSATLIKVTLLHGCFSRFLNCANGTKSRNASYLLYKTSARSQLTHLFTSDL